MIAVLEWIAESWWHSFLVCFLVLAFRPVRVNITHNHGDDE